MARVLLLLQLSLTFASAKVTTAAYAYATIVPAAPSAVQLVELRALVRSIRRTGTLRDVIVVLEGAAEAAAAAATTRAALASLDVVAFDAPSLAVRGSPLVLWSAGRRLGYARLIFLRLGSVALRDMEALFACGPQLCATAHTPFARASDVLVVTPTHAVSHRAVEALLAAHPDRFSAALAAVAHAAPLFVAAASDGTTAAAPRSSTPGLVRLGAQHSIDSLLFYEHGSWDRYGACGGDDGDGSSEIPSLSLSYNGGATAGGLLQPLLAPLLHPAQWYGYPLFEVHRVFASFARRDDDDENVPEQAPAKQTLLRRLAASAPPRASPIVGALACVAAALALLAVCAAPAPACVRRGVCAALCANAAVAAAVPATAPAEAAWLAMAVAPNGLLLLGVAALRLRPGEQRRCRSAACQLARVVAWQIVVLWSAWPSGSATARGSVSGGALAKPATLLLGLFASLAAQGAVVAGAVSRVAASSPLQLTLPRDSLEAATAAQLAPLTRRRRREQRRDTASNGP